MLLSSPLVLVPKTTHHLNPNADVFHGVTPQTMPPDYRPPSAAPWTEPDVATAADNPSGESHVNVNGEGLTSGTGRMAVIYSPNPDNHVGPDFGVMSGRLDSSQTLFAPGADVRSSIDDAGPLEDYVQPEQLRAMLKRQLEYYFSRENLAIDAYLVSQMDADQFVPISTVANFNQVKSLTRNFDLVVEVLRESANVQVDELGEKVRPLHKRCIVILREIPESTPIEEVEKLFSSELCPAFVGCQFAHNNSWYVTFDNEEDAQRAYRYLREEVKTFRGMPIMARIKAKPLLRCSYVAKDVNSDCALNSFQQQKFTYTSPVPSIQYIPPQNLPYFTPHSSMSPVWPTSVVFYDPGMAFAANGYVPTATYTPPAPLHSLPPAASLQTCSAVCEDLQNPRNRVLKSRFSARQNVLDHDDAYENEFRRCWPPTQGTRVPDEEFYEYRRHPRYGGGGAPPRILGHANQRPEFFRVGNKPLSSRAGVNCRNTVTRNSDGVPRSGYNVENDCFSYGSVGCQPECGVQASSSLNSSAVSVGELTLPPRPSGSYKSRRKNRNVHNDSTKISETGKDGVETNGEVIELGENCFPPLPKTEKSSASTKEKTESVLSDADQSVIQVEDQTQQNSDEVGFQLEQSEVAWSTPVESHSTIAAVNISLSDTCSCPTSAASRAYDKESEIVASANDVTPGLNERNPPQRYENYINCIEKCVVSEVAGLATIAGVFIPNSTSVCSLCPISDLHLSEDDDWKLSLKPSYAQMALRGKGRQESKVLRPVDSKSSPNAVASCGFGPASVSVASSVKRAETNDAVEFSGKEMRLERSAIENGCCLLKGHEQRKMAAVPAWN